MEEILNVANSTASLPTRNGRLVNRKFTEFFFSSVLMAASISLSIIIDAAIVGNILGSSALGAINLIMPLTLCFSAISGMFGIGSATCISMFKVKMDSESANKSLTLSRCVSWDNSFTVKALYHLGFSWPLTAEKYIERAINALYKLGFFDCNDE